MDIDVLIRYTTEGMLLCMYVSLPIVMVAGLVGLAISFFQAVVSMQDQALSHGIKLVCVMIAVAVTAPHSAAAVLRFANELMQTAIPQ
jgi:type III secretion protein S